MALQYASLATRLMAAVQFEANSGCWLWSADMNRHGYGRISVSNKKVAAHRASYREFVGDPGELCVCHRCDTPACINPDHLFLGTKADNGGDAAAKGRARAPTGEKNGRSVLNANAVRAIRAALSGGSSQSMVARDFGVSATTINSIAHGLTWRDV